MQQKTQTSEKTQKDVKTTSSLPFFELGPIQTPTYDFDFEELVKQDQIKTVKFSPDNQPFMEVAYKPDICFKLTEIPTCDQNYVNRHCSFSDGLFDELSGVAILCCAARQILNTFDASVKAEWISLVQMLNSELSVPKPWTDIIHCFGNKTSPYGLVKIRDPIQVVLDILCSMVSCLSRSSRVDIRNQLSPKEKPIFDAVMESISEENNASHCYLPNVQASRDFLSNYASRIWDKASGTRLRYTEVQGNVRVSYDLSLPTSSELKKLRGVEATNFLALLRHVVGDENERLVCDSLCRMILKMDVDQAQLELITTEVVLVDVRTDQLLKVIEILRGYFLRHIQPVLKQLYSLEVFQPTNQGHSAQLVERDQTLKKFKCKVNLSKYPLALGCTLDMTKETMIIKDSYFAYSELEETQLSIFTLKDLNF